MDVKTSAKSKRAHSLHNKPKKPPQTAPSTATTPPRKQGNQKNPPPNQRRPPPSLPSNWDRYEEDEVELGLVIENKDFSSDASKIFVKGADSDAVKPRSKGADFSHLVAEAQNELRNRPRGAKQDCFLSFDDNVSDFDEGFSSVLSIHGKSLVSWNFEDNFVVDDHANSSYEATFLSIDLDSLAEHLAKLDVSKRLLIEADLLPAGLGDHAENSHASDTGDILIGHGLGLLDKDDANENTTLPSTIMPVDTIIVEHPSSLITSDQVLIRDTVKSTKFSDGSAERVVDYQEKSTRFEAAAAEAELDMLLDSFGETEILDSFDVHEKPGNSFPEYSSSSQDHNSTKNITGALDDLLNEISHVPNRKPAYFSRQERPGCLHPSSHDHGSTKNIAAISALDVSIDDLLSETAHVPSQKPSFFSQQERPSCLNPLCTVQNPLDDLDSLLNEG